ncbi:hypothetical protein PIB30_011136 [Stylosanthes scabra]|uniref:Uncharacterized protein n=1 Tax=Stylosanthes scabra TaxID=79078 RepID=A0ABU6Q5T8_9FABA|nr:hypothetical protein [Stylosanthes scabra]
MGNSIIKSRCHRYQPEVRADMASVEIISLFPCQVMPSECRRQFHSAHLLHKSCSFPVKMHCLPLLET